MKIRSFALSLLLSTIITGLFSFSVPGPQRIENDVLSYTNRFRKSHGLEVLIMRDDLSKIAQKHSEDMASGRTGFGHSGFDQRQALAQQRIKDANSFAENVAYGATSGRQVVDEWKGSPGHRRNLLGPYKYVGIGTATDNRGRIYYTQLFVD